MRVGMGTLQDEFELSGEFQTFLASVDKAKDRGHDVRVFSAAGDHLRANGFLVHKHGEFIINKFFEQRRFIRQAVWVSKNVDRLHLFLPMPKFLWIADEVKRLTGTRVQVTCLGENVQVPSKNWLAYLFQSPQFYGVRFLFSLFPFEGRFQCDRYFVGSRYVGRQLEKAGCPPEKIRIVLPELPKTGGLDEPTPDLAGAMEKVPAFLYVGHFFPNKGVRVLLEAFARIPGTEARLVLAWSGLGNLKRVERDVERWGLEGKVKIVKEKIHLPSAFRRSVGLVLPYLTSFGQVSPPLLLLEAFKIGVPVIVSKLPSIEDVAEGRALFSKPLDPIDLSDKMLLLLRNQNIKTTLLENQRKFADNWASNANTADRDLFG